jgi:hypothetical protein
VELGARGRLLLAGGDIAECIFPDPLLDVLPHTRPHMYTHTHLNCCVHITAGTTAPAASPAPTSRASSSGGMRGDKEVDKHGRTESRSDRVCGATRTLRAANHNSLHERRWSRAQSFRFLWRSAEGVCAEFHCFRRARRANERCGCPKAALRNGGVPSARIPGYSEAVGIADGRCSRRCQWLSAIGEGWRRRGRVATQEMFRSPPLCPQAPEWASGAVTT